MKIEIYFDDLNKQKQIEILKILGVDSPKDLNWDVIPMCEIIIED